MKFKINVNMFENESDSFISFIHNNVEYFKNCNSKNNSNLFIIPIVGSSYVFVNVSNQKDADQFIDKHLQPLLRCCNEI